MAEYLCRTALGNESAWRVVSAGISGTPGIRASDPAVRVVDEIGIDLRPHLSQPVDRTWVETIDIIVVMTSAHQQQMRMLYPDAAEKIFMLTAFSHDFKGDVIDPIGLTDDVYRQIRDMIREALPDLIDFLKNLV